MIVTNSNYIDGSIDNVNAALSITPVLAGQDKDVIKNQDFSQVYIGPANTATTTLSINFSGSADAFASYIAISGSNITQKSSVEVKLDGATVYSKNYTLAPIDESRTIVIPTNNFNPVSIIQITIQAPAGDDGLVIGNISCGRFYQVPNGGEQAGYARAWSVPNIKTRNATNLQNMPVSFSYQSRPMSLMLSIPNNLMADYEALSFVESDSSYYYMLQYITKNNFYILEDDNPEHSYVCFNAMAMPTKAHSSTRSLGVSSFKFNAFSKMNDVFL
jgi:hypothetical protein